jgi:uncharacterized protein YjgD (DUF1641 family)
MQVSDAPQADATTPTPPHASDGAAQIRQGYTALLGAVDSALTDAAVERWTALGEEWLGLLGSSQVRDLVAETLPLLPYLTEFVRRLRPMVEAGLLDRLLELATLLTAVLDAVTPMQAERLAVEAEGLATLANNVMTEDPAIVWRASVDRLLTTWQEAGESPKPVGLGELLRLRRDPAVQRALRALLRLAHEAPRPS